MKRRAFLKYIGTSTLPLSLGAYPYRNTFAAEENVSSICNCGKIYHCGQVPFLGSDSNTVYNSMPKLDIELIRF